MGSTVQFARMSTDRRWLITGQPDGALQVWDLQAAQPTTTGHSLPSPPPDFNGQEGLLVAGHWPCIRSSGDVLTLWGLAAPDCAAPLRT